MTAGLQGLDCPTVGSDLGAGALTTGRESEAQYNEFQAHEWQLPLFEGKEVGAFQEEELAYDIMDP